MPDPTPTTSTAQTWWETPQFTGIDSEIAAKENLVNEQAWNSINIPWLLALSVSQGNAMTQAIAANAVILCETEWGNDGGGGGNESGASMFGGGGATGGLSVSW